MNRPTADLTTSLGIAGVVGTFFASAVIVILHNPTVATLSGIGTAGAALIYVIQRAPIPSPQPTPVLTHDADVVATKEHTP